MTKESYRRKNLIGLTVPEARESNMAERHGSKQQVWWLEQKAKSSHHEPQVGSSERKLQVGQVLKLSKATSDDILLLTRPSLLTILEHYHQLGTRNSNAGDYGGYFYADHHTLRTRLASWDACCPFWLCSYSAAADTHPSELPAAPASTLSLPLTYQNSTDYFVLPTSMLSSRHSSSCSFVASSLPTANYWHFPVSDTVNQLSIFLQALFVLRFLKSMV